MIKNKKDYKDYLECDRVALNRKGKIPSYFDVIWRFEILMRKLEYYENCNKNKLYKFYLKYRYKRLSIKLGYEIPINTFGPGLSIAHRGNIIINGATRIGSNCRVHVGVNIGTEAGYSNKAPIIGDNVYIGPGVKIFGKIEIGNNVAIGANSVVNKSFSSGISIAGVPAKIINNKGSDGLLIKGHKI